MPAAFPLPANVSTQPLPIDPFTPAERVEFRLSESILDGHLEACKKALSLIRDQKLFREYGSLGRYARERHGLAPDQLKCLLALPVRHA